MTFNIYTVTALSTLVNKLAIGLVTIKQLKADLRTYRAANTVDKAELQDMLRTALAASDKDYANDAKLTGVEYQKTALRAQVKRIMADTDPESGAVAAQTGEVTKAGKKVTADQKALKAYMAEVVAELMAQGWTKTDIKAAI